MKFGSWSAAEDYWGNRQQLKTKTQQIDAALDEARVALLDGKIPAAKRLYLESYEVEQEAQSLAQQIGVPGPAGRVAAAFDLAMREKFDATVRGDLADASAIRIQFQGMAEIEQALTGGTEALALLPRALIEKSRQAINGKQFDRAEQYLEQLLDLDPANVEAQIGLADVLLDRARESIDNGSAVLLLVKRARANYERVKDFPEFAGRRGRFENELAELQAAAHFATGEQARQRWRLLSARDNFRLVPDESPYGTQARERGRAVAFQLGAGALIVVGAIAVLLLVLIRPFAGSPATPSTPTAVALNGTALPSTSATGAVATAPSTIGTTPTTPTTAPSETAVSAPTAAIAATAVPGQLNAVLIGRITAEGVAVYRDADRAKAGYLFNLSRNTRWYLCAYDEEDGSYLIARDSCETTNERLGWINAQYVAVTPQLNKPTPK